MAGGSNGCPSAIRSRVSVALEVERRMETKDVVRVLAAAVAERDAAPKFIRSDNGPAP